MPTHDSDHLNSCPKLPIPTFPEVPPLTAEQIDALTRIVFLKPVPPVPCDLIFIFGGTHPGAWQTGAEAYRAGLGPRILVTGGIAKNPKVPHSTWQQCELPLSRIIAGHLIELGVPAIDIISNEQPENTLEEALCLKEFVSVNSIQSIIVVGKSYAAGRQMRTLQKHLPSEIQLVPYFYDTNLGEGPVVTRDNWMKEARSRSFVFGEYLRIIAYGEKGYLIPLTSRIENLRI